MTAKVRLIKKHELRGLFTSQPYSADMTTLVCHWAACKTNHASTPFTRARLMWIASIQLIDLISQPCIILLENIYSSEQTCGMSSLEEFLVWMDSNPLSQSSCLHRPLNSFESVYLICFLPFYMFYMCNCTCWWLFSYFFCSAVPDTVSRSTLKQPFPKRENLQVSVGRQLKWEEKHAHSNSISPVYRRQTRGF